MSSMLIPVGNKFALIDVDDYELVSRFKWHPLKSSNDRVYASAHIYRGHKRTAILMHRLIMSAPREWEVDHINHNGLDNRKPNLRYANRLQNSHNQRVRVRGKKSRFKGVARHRNKWTSRIVINKQNVYLGIFATEEEAAIAYNNAASKHFGEFACLNQI